ncbi:methyltransferase [Sphaerisporangium album]|uniref:Methyltransferase n=1 Tax=Sphaerisporangium album TaxID=509200 RepID=A0A367F409_9ACTN|nr:methyltransferase [Sphaerisporangium album]RCG24495.1 methyltransferase [Sphaerisporangium album]
MDRPFEQVMGMICGFWVSRGIYAATRLGIPDLLAGGPKSSADLAALTGSHPRSLYRLLRALAGVGLFTQQDEVFGLTELGATLRSDVPASLSSFVLMELGPSHHRAWGELVHAIRTGEPAFDEAMGMSAWQMFARDPEMAGHLGRAMHGLTENVVAAVLETYDFSGFSRVVDIGGGEGGFLTAVLKAQPAATGVLFDLPYVMDNARDRLRGTAEFERCELVGGDFFEKVPDGGDLYLLKWVLHDWGDDECRAILGNCRQAIAEGGTLLVVDTVIPAGSEPAPGKFIDLNMMVLGSGRERTAEEFAALFAASGFELTRVLPMRSPSGLVEARPV